MNRSARIALTTAATSAVVAGAAGVVTLGVLGPAAAQGPGTAAITSEPAAAPDPATSRDEALARLTREAAALQAELSAARHRLDSAGASGPAASPGGPAGASAGRQATRPAPPVHARTGASGAAGHHEAEVEVEDD